MYLLGLGTIGDLLGDLVAYRSLQACDARLSDVPVPTVVPRKIQPEYARVVVELLEHARQLDAPGVALRRIIVVGDNAPSDGASFEHLRALTGWSGTALIVDERAAGTAAHSGRADAPARSAPDGALLRLSHWSELRAWAAGPGGAGIDETTAILLDIDKTLLGARGRNDQVIDDARARATRAVVTAALGSRFSDTAFEEARATFNRAEFHNLTGDNQDYVAYICLIVAGGIFSTDELRDAIHGGHIATIEDLVAAVDARVDAHPEGLRDTHRAIAARVAQADPTPFKEFRTREYLETVSGMGTREAVDPEERLKTELVLTAEVLEVARGWKAAGALLFALSDKPDEAALPTDELRRQGFRPLHWTPTHIVGVEPPLTRDED